MKESNIRNSALNWFNTKYPSIVDAIFTSKFYTPEESWSKSRVWFFQIPLEAINTNKHKYINLVCENHLQGEKFLYLKVPTLFLLENEDLFDIDPEKNKMRIYLSAEGEDMYKEVRKSKLDFSEFLQV